MVRTGQAKKLTPINTNKYCISYLDFLGAEKFMKDDQDNKFLNDLNSIYFDAIHDVEFIGFVSQKDIFVKIFSDNILLAIKIDENDTNRKEKITKIINLTGNIYNNALAHGYLLRGAITEGAFYKDKNFVYGKALIDAVEMEEKLAIYPRIIVQKSIQEILPQYFIECSDGCISLENFYFFPGLPEVYKHKLKEIYKKYHNDEKVRQKIMWVITHFNSFYSDSQFVNQIKITNKELIEATKKEVLNA